MTAHLLKWLKPAVFFASLLPMAYIAWQVAALASGQPGSLGADPGKAIVLFLGTWSINFLVLALSVTPVRQVFGWPAVARLRRMLGLFAFFYVLLHASAYAVFLLELRFAEIGAEILKRPYITVGATALLLLVPLAVTSNRFMIARLRQNWVKLHKLVYLVAVLAVVHLVWLTRSDYTEAVVYGVLLGGLLAFRAVKTGLFSTRHNAAALIPEGK